MNRTEPGQRGEEAAPQTAAASLELAQAAAAACDHRNAERWGLLAMALADVSTDVAPAVEGLVLAGWSQVERGKPTSALRTFRRALAPLDSQSADVEMRGRVYHNLQAAAGMAGQRGAAEEYGSRALRIFAIADDPRRMAVLANAAWFRMDAGDFGPALDVLPRAVERVGASPFGYAIRANHAVALAAAGRSGARAALEELASTVAGGPQPHLNIAWGWFAYGWGMAFLGETDRAREAALRAHAEAAARSEMYALSRAANLIGQLGGGINRP